MFIGMNERLEKQRFIEVSFHLTPLCSRSLYDNMLCYYAKEQKDQAQLIGLHPSL